MAYRVVQPYGRDRTREFTEVFRPSTVTAAFRHIDLYASRVRVSNVPGEHLELILVDDDGREVTRPTH